ncbi:AfsR/SARP family transcriptional regulator [Glycomyces tenuis]|uniref:AfsR/SARP family transcriptional regulator n=3 Tax=Glycomyces tenuis TaxID=58116 RepID=UPI0006867F5C|nr:BTAD domain-containing putative transcriptional regulator [Glycomyces tenuis]
MAAIPDPREPASDDHTEDLTVGLLGPLAVDRAGEAIAVTTGRLRTLLAVLATAPNRTVPYGRLATAIWDDDAPGHLRRTLQTYAGRLRGLLGRDRIDSAPAGLRLRVPERCVDLVRFEHLLRDAAGAADARDERPKLVTALKLWRGEAFEDVDSLWLRRTAAPRLEEMRLEALERRIDLDLAAGGHVPVAAELAELVARHPLREPLWARFLVALDRGGRRAEALDRFETVRTRLADELGADPGPELRRLHGELLGGEALTWGRDTPAPAITVVAPRQLPARPAVFVAREEPLRRLDRRLDRGSTETGVHVITGTAGVGKTALALHWAHRAAHRFPDGQLYIDLDGFSPHGAPADPADALGAFLHALGVGTRELPDGLKARSALYRTLAADRRLLIVLDNARDSAQVRPLLPGSGGSLTVVTSRDRLTGLVAAYGAEPIRLPPLTAAESHRLLAARLGREPGEREPDAAAVVTACAGLPLALVVASAQADPEAERPLAALAARLRDGGRLDALATGEAGTEVRAVLTSSYRSLERDAARLLRLLALAPGRTVSTAAAASLLGLPARATGGLLAELGRASMVTEERPGRYAVHDLLRDFAAELTEAFDPAQRREAARRRVFLHYLHTAHRAARLLEPQMQPLELPRADRPVVVTEPRDEAEALAWFDAEAAALVALVGQCRDGGGHERCCQLASVLTGYFDRQGHWHVWAKLQELALESAVRLGRKDWQAQAHRSIARALTRLERYDEARVRHHRALDMFEELGDLHGQATVLKNLGYVEHLLGRHRLAAEYNLGAFERYRRLGNTNGEADALNNIGWCLAQLGEYERAVHHCLQALRRYRTADNRAGAANVWDSLGFVISARGHHASAAYCFRRALAFREQADSGLYPIAGTLRHLADNHRAAGEPEPARAAYSRALAVLERLGHSDAAKVRAALAALDRADRGGE